MFTRLSKVLMFTILGAAGPTVLGQGVGGNSPVDTSHTLTPIGTGDIPGDWRSIIGTSVSPVAVELDPAGPAWAAHFQTENGVPINRNSGVVWIQENLIVSGSMPWTGWHSEIATDGFIWYPYSDFPGLPDPTPFFKRHVNGSSVPADIQISGDTIGVNFPVLAPGTMVEILQKIMWTETTPFVGSIELRQYPVPEPASLLGLGFLFLISHRRR